MLSTLAYRNVFVRKKKRTGFHRSQGFSFCSDNYLIIINCGILKFLSVNPQENLSEEFSKELNKTSP